MIHERSDGGRKLHVTIEGTESDVKREFQDYFDRYVAWDGYGGIVERNPAPTQDGTWRAIITRYSSCD